MNDENIIPFEMEDKWQGFAKTSGLLSFDGECIIIEFQTVDALFGVIRSPVKRIKIKVDRLNFVKHASGITKNNLIVSAKSLKTIEPFPSKNNYEVLLKFKKAYKEDVNMLVSRVNLKIAEIKLEKNENNY